MMRQVKGHHDPQVHNQTTSSRALQTAGASCFQSTSVPHANLQLGSGNSLASSPSNPDPICDDELEELICDCVDLLLSTLPPEQENVVRAVDVAGTPPKSVAKYQGLSFGAMTKHLTLGRQGLIDRFGEMRMICPQHNLTGCTCHRKGDVET
jgi:DNA-directed RNA polymerase specialized sigma24 family protein